MIAIRLFFTVLSLVMLLRAIWITSQESSAMDPEHKRKALVVAILGAILITPVATTTVKNSFVVTLPVGGIIYGAGLVMFRLHPKNSRGLWIVESSMSRILGRIMMATAICMTVSLACDFWATDGNGALQIQKVSWRELLIKYTPTAYGEEIFFRGFMQKYIDSIARERLRGNSLFFVDCIVAILFAGAHDSPIAGMIFRVPIGLVLSRTARSEGLACAMIVHFCYDLLINLVRVS